MSEKDRIMGEHHAFSFSFLSPFFSPFFLPPLFLSFYDFKNKEVVINFSYLSLDAVYDSEAWEETHKQGGLHRSTIVSTVNCKFIKPIF